MTKMSAKAWGILALCWAVIAVGYWIVAGASAIAWSIVVIALLFVAMWWIRVRQERK